MGAPGGVPGPRTFCLKRRPVRAAFSRCLVSELTSGQPSTEPILQRWSPTASRQPQYVVPHAADFPGVGVCYESIASEKNSSCEPVQETTQQTPERYGTGNREGELRQKVPTRRPKDAATTQCTRIHLARWFPSECQWPDVPCAGCGRVAPPHLQPPLISPPTDLRGRARDSRLGAPNSNPAKFICMGKRKNAAHTTKTKNRYVRLFCKWVSD